MGASQNADFVTSSNGGTGKPNVERVNRSFAQPAPEAKEVAPPVEEAKASKEETEKKKADAIVANSKEPSKADADTFVSKENVVIDEDVILVPVASLDENAEEVDDEDKEKEEENSVKEQEPDTESD